MFFVFCCVTARTKKCISSGLHSSPILYFWHVGVVIEHRSVESEGLRFDTSWGLRIFSFSHTRDEKRFSLFLYRAKNLHLPFLLLFSELILSHNVTFISGHCLACYQCMSAKSWSDCGSEAKKQTCPLGWSACAKVELKIPRWEGTLYAKGCVYTEERCKDVQRKKCSDLSQNLCSVHCCSGDKCNSGTQTTVSTITFLACAFVAFISLVRWLRNYFCRQTKS